MALHALRSMGKMMRRSARRIWGYIAVGAVLVLLPVLLDLFKGPVSGLISSFPLWIDVVGLVVIASLYAAFAFWYEKLKPASDTSVANRQSILNRVQNKWITGFLENALYFDKELLPLGLHRRV